MSKDEAAGYPAHARPLGTVTGSWKKKNISSNGTRLWDAAIIMVGHACLGAVIVVCMWGLEHLIEALGHGKTMLIYGRWPLEYLFQTVDLAMVLVIAVYGLWEMIGVLTGKRPL